MSQTNGTPKSEPTTAEKLKAIQEKRQLLQESLQLRILERQAQLLGSPSPDQQTQSKYRSANGDKSGHVPLTEAWGWGELVGVQLDPRRRIFDDPLWRPVNTFSHPSDRAHGHNWPIFRQDAELNRLRQASRVLVETNPQAQGVLKNLINYIIAFGFSYEANIKKKLRDIDDQKEGFQPQPKAEELEGELQDWLDDFSDRVKWPQREREIFLRIYRDGEVFLRFFHLDDGTTQIRFIEPEQIQNPPGGTQIEGWTYGIRHQMEPHEDVETVIEYHVKYSDATEESEIVPAKDILHIKALDTDSTIKRGLPAFVYDTYDAYTRASELQRNLSIGAAIRAATAEAWEHEFLTKDQITDYADSVSFRDQTNPTTLDTERLEHLAPGTIRRLPQGIKPIPLGNPGMGENIQVIQGDLRHGNAAFCAPEYFTGDASNANFASTREAGTPFVKYAEAVQNYLKAFFLKVFRRAAKHAQAKGKLSRDVFRFVEIKCEPPAVMTTDRMQQAQIDQVYVSLGAKDRQTVAQEQGYDWEQIEANNAEYEEQHGGMFGGLGGEMGEPDNEIEGEDFFGEDSANESVMESGKSGVFTDKLGRRQKFVDGKRVKLNQDKPKRGSKKQKTELKFDKEKNVFVGTSAAVSTTRMRKGVEQLQSEIPNRAKAKLAKDQPNQARETLSVYPIPADSAEAIAGDRKKQVGLVRTVSGHMVGIARAFSVGLLLQVPKDVVALVKTVGQLKIVGKGVAALVGKSEWTQDDTKALGRALYDLPAFAVTQAVNYTIPTGALFPILYKTPGIKEIFPKTLTEPGNDPISRVLDKVDKATQIPERWLRGITEAMEGLLDSGELSVSQIEFLLGLLQLTQADLERIAGVDDRNPFALQEGKSGVFTDKSGRRFRLQNGKRVPLQDMPTKPQTISSEQDIADTWESFTSGAKQRFSQGALQEVDFSELKRELHLQWRDLQAELETANDPEDREAAIAAFGQSSSDAFQSAIDELKTAEQEQFAGYKRGATVATVDLNRMVDAGEAEDEAKANNNFFQDEDGNPYRLYHDGERWQFGHLEELWDKGISYPKKRADKKLLAESVTEGKTGIFQDKLGRRQKFIDGKRVPIGDEQPASVEPSSKANEAVLSGLQTSGLPEATQKQFAQSAGHVSARMPEPAQKRFTANTQGGVQFFASGGEAVLAGIRQWANLPETQSVLPKEAIADHVAQWENLAQNGTFGGAYNPSVQGLFLDGGEEAFRSGENFSPDLDAAKLRVHIYAHEFAHAIDGPEFELSRNPKWEAAWKGEIKKVFASPLSKYAKTDPQEGFAEFGRLVYSGDFELGKIEAAFPKASQYWKGLGLWPTK